MKIDRQNWRHWVYSFLAVANILIAVVVRYLTPRPKARAVVMYGHKFNGNIKAFADYCTVNALPNVKYYFLTMDPRYRTELVTQGTALPILSLTRLADVLRVVRGDVIITDHGPQLLALLKKFTPIKFVDVWHGIPFKGFVTSDMESMHNYDEIWVSSAWMRKVYIKELGFRPKSVKVTGYARTDKFVNGMYDSWALRKKYGIDKRYKSVILVAPTWQQDEVGRSIVPFGVTEKAFLEALNAVGKGLNALVIFRAHLNVGATTSNRSLPYLRNMPYAQYPDAEEFMAMADVLVTDWSSMVFDYLPTRRPVIFLDVKAPFKNGFTVEPKYRFGDVVGDLGTLKKSIERAVLKAGAYKKDYEKLMMETEDLVFGGTADGRACERYQQQLKELLRDA